MSPNPAPTHLKADQPAQASDKPGLLIDLARIMDQEQDCCSFLRIQLTMKASEGPVTFDVTGPEGTADMLRKL